MKDSTNNQRRTLAEAQRKWANVACKQRASAALELRHLLLEHADDLFSKLDSRNVRSISEFISSELLSLAEACSWNAKHVSNILSVRKFRRFGLNLFLGRLRSEVIREPLGIVLIVGTWNYPVFLTGVQMLQALLAGNAVVVKPAPGAEAVTRSLKDLFVRSGFAADLMHITDSEPGNVDDWIDAGVDLIVMTASSRTGRAISEKAAKKLVPVIAELSGCDAMFVLRDANFDRVADAIVFGLRLNFGATCMAPRRVFVAEDQANNLLSKLQPRVAQLKSHVLRDDTKRSLTGILQDALQQGATFVCDCPTIESLEESGPVTARAIVLDKVTSSMNVAQADLFAPIISLMRQTSDDLADWVRCNDQCPYALTASVFGNADQAVQLAKRINASIVTINDVIAPTIEPSLSFGGRGESGFGTTRGAEGLRQMSREKSIVVREGNFLPHLEAPTEDDESLLKGLFTWLHGRTLRKRIEGIRTMGRAAKSKSLSK